MRGQALRELGRDAARYRFLRGKRVDGSLEGLFIGQVPDNVILTDADADEAVDSEIAKRKWMQQ